jgi:hypothetical protein
VTVEAVVLPASFGWVSLQLHYDGREPPVGLLDDIAHLGWSVPPPPARPASAIDWYTPDPLTGQRFTVRPWHAVHDIEAPGRHSAPATWPADRRAGALRALASVFLGHSVVVTSSVPELAALARGDGPEPFDPCAPAAEPPRRGQAGADMVIVSFSARVEQRDRIEAMLRAGGLVHRTSAEAQTRRQVFRGSVSEHSVLMVVGEALVRRDGVDALRARLREQQAAAEVRPAGPEDLERVAAARVGAAATPPGVAGAEAHFADGAKQAVLQVEVARGAEGVVDRIVAHPSLAGLPVTVSPGTRPAVTQFRGTVSETRQPCLLVEVSCPPGRVRAVLAVLAHETGVAENQIDVRLPPADR